jgi:FkbM family methyltransferase
MLNGLKWRSKAYLGYIKKYGFVCGSKIFLKLYTRKLETGKKTKTLHVNIYDNALAVRIGASDISVFQAVFLEDAFDLSSLCSDPKLILDLGANVGYASVYFSHTYPTAKVLAVEPEESNFKILQENTAPYKNVVPIQAAIWSKKEKLQIKDPNAEKWGIQVSEFKGEESSVAVDAVTVDELLEKSGFDAIDILKIDIEGAEQNLFSGNYESWLKKTRVLVIELHGGICAQVFNKAVDGFGFNRMQRGEHTILFKQ